MRTLLLDRGNEQLLLKCALHPKPKLTPAFAGNDAQKKPHHVVE